MILGIIGLSATGVGFLYPRLRRVGTELPDVIMDSDDSLGEEVARYVEASDGKR
jgi:hypothetical protein